MESTKGIANFLIRYPIYERVRIMHILGSSRFDKKHKLFLSAKPPTVAIKGSTKERSFGTKPNLSTEDITSKLFAFGPPNSFRTDAAPILPTLW